MTHKPSWLSDEAFAAAEVARIRAVGLVRGVRDGASWALDEADVLPDRERIYRLARVPFGASHHKRSQ